MIHAGASIAALFLAAAGIGAQAVEPAASVGDPWISEAPPRTGVAAAYMVIYNGGDRSITLSGAGATGFEKVEMHESALRDGMASMHRLDRVEIPAGETVSFAPGGRHFMLFGKPPLPGAGENVSMTLQFADGATIDVNVPVRARISAIPE